MPSTERLKKWFGKLHMFVPGGFIRNRLKPEPPKNRSYNDGSGDNKIFSGQKNLDVIMDTLRSDLTSALGESNKSATKILSKLNLIYDSIREACRFQPSWSEPPIPDREKLKVQEEYIVKLIEELIDEMGTHRSAINCSKPRERSIEGIICVLKVLKSEVSNTIHAIIAFVRAHEAAVGTSLSKSMISHQYRNYSKNTTFSNEPSFFKTNYVSYSISYPMLQKRRGQLFSSVQNVYRSANPFENYSEYNPLLSTKDNTNDHKYRIKPSEVEYDKKARDIKLTMEASNRDLRNKLSTTALQNSSRPLKHDLDTSPAVFDFFQSSFASKNEKPACDPPHKAKIAKHEGKASDMLKKLSNQRNTMLSWPNAIVARNAKSECRVDVAKSKNANLSNESSDSDSDESYVSVESEDELETNVFGRKTDKGVQVPKKNYDTFRNKIEYFSCKSSKMSQLLLPQKPRRLGKFHGNPEVCIRIEYVPFENCVAYIKEMTTLQKTITGRNTPVSTRGRMHEKLSSMQTSQESFNKTLALSSIDDGCNRASPMMSVSSLISETLHQSKRNLIENKPSDHRLLAYRKDDLKADLSLNLQDSAFSSMCLPIRPKSGKSAGEYNKLWALEVNSKPKL